ncbi:MAG TPA: hypothetical protein VJI15_02835 [Candidatus Nanoarchaeia archaeon]|nr:hypothetical protein [Candidatus Nanoarchaeia archaeon]
MRNQYSGWNGPWLKYNGREVPLRIEGISNSPDGYIEMDVPSLKIKVHNFHDCSRVNPNLSVVKNGDGSIKSYSATLNGVNLDDYIPTILAEFGIKE